MVNCAADVAAGEVDDWAAAGLAEPVDEFRHSEPVPVFAALAAFEPSESSTRMLDCSDAELDDV